MPIVRTDRSSVPFAAVVPALLLTGALVTGCGGGSPVSSPTAPSSRGQLAIEPGSNGVPVPADLDAELTRVLDARAGALLQGDRTAFTRLIDRGSPDFVTEQEGYFDNLAQLPIASLSYHLDPTSLVRTGSDYWVVVETSLRLAGFDSAPVTSPDRFRFSPTGRRGGFRLSSTTDAAWEAANHVQGQPWDTEPVQVRTGPGVLGVFDQGTVADAAMLMRSVGRGIQQVQTRVPYDWDGTVVFYALSDDAFLAGLGNVPGGDPETLDGVAFTLPTSPTDPTVADTRIVLNPSLLGAAPASRDRLIRHELTHVAVGSRDDGVPLWLSEGLAEWVSVQPMSRRDQRIPAAALATAEAPGLRMPRDSSFNGPDAATNYAIGWWTCEYLAATYGANEPWVVLDELEGPDVDERSVTRSLFDLTPDQLARRAAKLMVSTYDPGFHAPPTPGH